MGEQEYKDVVDLVEHKPIDNFDLEDLNLINDRLLIGKYDLFVDRTKQDVKDLNLKNFELRTLREITTFIKEKPYFYSLNSVLKHLETLIKDNLAEIEIIQYEIIQKKELVVNG